MNVIISHIQSNQFLGVRPCPSNINDRSVLGIVGTVSTPVIWTYDTHDHSISTIHHGSRLYWDRYINNEGNIFLYNRKTPHEFQRFPGILLAGHFAPINVTFDSDIPQHEWEIQQLCKPSFPRDYVNVIGHVSRL
jgi:hypothetical protein